MCFAMVVAFTFRRRYATEAAVGSGVLAGVACLVSFGWKGGDSAGVKPS